MISYIICYICTHTCMESTLCWHVRRRRNAKRPAVIIIFTGKKTERTNCTAVGICVHENAEEQNEVRYFLESRHVCK